MTHDCIDTDGNVHVYSGNLFVGEEYKFQFNTQTSKLHLYHKHVLIAIF